MKMRISLLLSAAAALTLGACVSSPPPPRPIIAYPAVPVAQMALPPPVETVAPSTDLASAETGPAAPMPDASQAAEVRKTDVIGGWTLASAGETCQLSMNLTAWNGGYRASTRGCASDELKSVGAWDLDGKTVLLKDASGSVVARLMATGQNRYSGVTAASKRGVQFFRG